MTVPNSALVDALRASAYEAGFDAGVAWLRRELGLNEPSQPSREAGLISPPTDPREPAGPARPASTRDIPPVPCALGDATLDACPSQAEPPRRGKLSLVKPNGRRGRLLRFLGEVRA